MLKDGIIVVDKPKGCTSFDVVFKIKKILKVKKAGHTGTLDPIATGVLPIFYNKATKFISYLSDSNKEYLAEFKFGIKTDTQDITGVVLKKEHSNVSFNELKKSLSLFIGNIWQKPPMYSAVKINGVALYKLARKGIVVERNKRLVQIYSLKCLEFNEKEQKGIIKVFASSGTYVRTLIEDLATSLKTFGILTSLKRTKACGFFLNECLNLNQIEKLDEFKLEKLCFSVDEAFKELKNVKLNLMQQKKFLNGVAIKLETNLTEGEFLRVYGDRFLGLAIFENKILKPKRTILN